MFAPDELLAALVDAEVEFVLIGGFAVGAHGHPRATKDVDIVPSPDAGNLRHLARLLAVLDATPVDAGDFAPDEFPYDPRDPQQLATGGNFLLETRLGRLDVMQWVAGMPEEHTYDHLRRHAVETAVLGRRIVVCSREDLIAMKRAAGRPQDLLDLEALGADAG